MKKFLENLEKSIQEFTPVIFLISIGLEAYLIIRIFYDLPRNAADVIYWVLVGAVIMGSDAVIVLEIKKSFICKKWAAFVGFCLGYLVILFILFFAALGYNLKAISGKSDYRSLNSQVIEDLRDEAASDRKAKEKYEVFLERATNENDIYKFRDLITDQEKSISKLDAKLEGYGMTNSDNNSDAFTLIADKIKWDKNSLIFSFLSAIWAVLVMVTLLTAPVIGTIEEVVADKSIKADESVKAWIKENADNVQKFVNTMFRSPGESLLLKSTDRIAEESGIDPKECERIWSAFAYKLYIKRGKVPVYLIKASAGKTEAQFSFKEIYDSIIEFINS